MKITVVGAALIIAAAIVVVNPEKPGYVPATLGAVIDRYVRESLPE